MNDVGQLTSARIEKTLKVLADAADEISMNYFHRQNELTAEQKHDGSFVTEADKAVELAENIQNAESAEVAAEMLAELTKLTDAILNGIDADGNGRIGWQEGEGGLSQAVTNMGLIKRAEGIGG